MRKSNYLSNLSAYCSKANLRVTPKRGSAIMWYNHVTNKTSGWISSLDLRSYHGGCDVIRGHKWIVNNWINIIGGNWDDLRTWNDKNSRTKWGKKEFARYRALPKKGRIVEIRLEVDFHFFCLHLWWSADNSILKPDIATNLIDIYAEDVRIHEGVIHFIHFETTGDPCNLMSSH